LFDLQNDDVPEGGYWSKLMRMATAGSYGEPFFKLQIGETVGQWLIDGGMVEEVTERPWRSRKPCYRLTERGEAAIKRGKYAKGPPARPKVALAPPRLQTADSRRVKPRST
jgi:hypothetical protein